MRCLHCERDFPAGSHARAAIAIEVMGDEYIYSYWRCDACRQYTVEAYHDRFMGEDEVSFLPPVPEAVGDRGVELIRACPTPMDKWCDCASHRALYYGLPRE
jgi:hypothetical protein